MPNLLLLLFTLLFIVNNLDIQASLNLLDRGLKQLSISPTQLRQVLPKVTLKETSSGLLDEPKNPQQLRLFEWRDGRATDYLDSATIA